MPPSKATALLDISLKPILIEERLGQFSSEVLTIAQRNSIHLEQGQRIQADFERSVSGIADLSRTVRLLMEDARSSTEPRTLTGMFNQLMNEVEERIRRLPIARREVAKRAGLHPNTLLNLGYPIGPGEKGRSASKGTPKTFSMTLPKLQQLIVGIDRLEEENRAGMLHSKRKRTRKVREDLGAPIAMYFTAKDLESLTKIPVRAPKKGTGRRS